MLVPPEAAPSSASADPPSREIPSGTRVASFCVRPFDRFHSIVLFTSYSPRTAGTDAIKVEDAAKFQRRHEGMR